MKIVLNRPQFAFIRRAERFRAFVAGFRAGKTWIGCCGVSDHHLRHYNVPSAYYAPSYKIIESVFYPTMEEVCHGYGLKPAVKVGRAEVDIYQGKQYRGTVLCRTMEKPDLLVGYKVGHSLVDEIDVLPMSKADAVWKKVIARSSIKKDGLIGRFDITTTPEGYKWTYHTFYKNIVADMVLIQASTRENAKNLPDNYIRDLYRQYPSELVDAYIDGIFTNLTSGRVWYNYNRLHNASYESVGSQGDPNEALHIGMDFNVERMCAVVHVIRTGVYSDGDLVKVPHAVDEVAGAYDTPDLIKVLKERYPNNPIFVYPDAAGHFRASSNASNSSTSHAQLIKAGFRIVVNKANPIVVNRVASHNALLLNSEGFIGYRVNSLRCPIYADALEQQAYKNGKPEKDGSVMEDICDAGSYFSFKFRPITVMAPRVTAEISIGH